MSRVAQLGLLLLFAGIAAKDASSAPRLKRGRAVPRPPDPPVSRARVPRPRIGLPDLNPVDVDKTKRIGYAPGSESASAAGAGSDGSTSGTGAGYASGASAGGSALGGILGGLKSSLGGSGSGTGSGSGSGAGAGSGSGAGGGGDTGGGGGGTGGITYDDSQKKKGESADYGGGDKGGGGGKLDEGGQPKVVAFSKWFPMCFFVEQGANGNAIVKGAVDSAAACGVNLVAFPFYIDSNLPGSGQAAAQAAAQKCNAVDGLKKYGATRAAALIVTKNKNLPASMCRSPALKDKVGCAQLGWEPSPGQLFRQRGTGEDGGVAKPGTTSVAMISTPSVDQAIKYGLGMAMMSRPPGYGAGFGVGDPDEGWASAGAAPEPGWKPSGCKAMQAAAFPNNGQWRWNRDQDRYLVDAGDKNRLFDVVGGPQLFRPPKPPEKGDPAQPDDKGVNTGGKEIASGRGQGGGAGGGGGDVGGGGSAGGGAGATPGGGHQKPPGGGFAAGSAGAALAANGTRGSLRDQPGTSVYGPQPAAGGGGSGGDSGGGASMPSQLAGGSGSGSNSGGVANSARIRYDDNAQRGGTTPLAPIGSGGASNAPLGLLGSGGSGGGGGVSPGAADAFAASVGAGAGYRGPDARLGGGGVGGDATRSPAGVLDGSFWSTVAGGRQEGAPKPDKLRSRRDTGGVGYLRSGIYQ